MRKSDVTSHTTTAGTAARNSNGIRIPDAIGSGVDLFVSNNGTEVLVAVTANAYRSATETFQFWAGSAVAATAELSDSDPAAPGAAAPGTAAEASRSDHVHPKQAVAFTDVTGQIADGQIPASIARDSELPVASAAVPQKATNATGAVGNQRQVRARRPPAPKQSVAYSEVTGKPTIPHRRTRRPATLPEPPRRARQRRTAAPTTTTASRPARRAAPWRPTTRSTATGRPPRPCPWRTLFSQDILVSILGDIEDVVDYQDWKGDWKAGDYTAGNVVKASDGNYYLRLTDGTDGAGDEPTATDANWEQLAAGLRKARPSSTSTSPALGGGDTEAYLDALSGKAAGKYLQVNAANDGYEFMEAQAIPDWATLPAGYTIPERSFIEYKGQLYATKNDTSKGATGPDADVQNFQIIDNWSGVYAANAFYAIGERVTTADGRLATAKANVIPSDPAPGAANDVKWLVEADNRSIPVPNPSAAATAALTKVEIDGVVYSVAGGPQAAGLEFTTVGNTFAVSSRQLSDIPDFDDLGTIVFFDISYTRSGQGDVHMTHMMLKASILELMSGAVDGNAYKLQLQGGGGSYWNVWADRGVYSNSGKLFVDASPSSGGYSATNIQVYNVTAPKGDPGPPGPALDKPAFYALDKQVVKAGTGGVEIVDDDASAERTINVSHPAPPVIPKYRAVDSQDVRTAVAEYDQSYEANAFTLSHGTGARVTTWQHAWPDTPAGFEAARPNLAYDSGKHQFNYQQQPLTDFNAATAGGTERRWKCGLVITPDPTTHYAASDTITVRWSSGGRMECVAPGAAAGNPLPPKVLHFDGVHSDPFYVAFDVVLNGGPGRNGEVDWWTPLLEGNKAGMRMGAEFQYKLPFTGADYPLQKVDQPNTSGHVAIDNSLVPESIRRAYGTWRAAKWEVSGTDYLGKNAPTGEDKADVTIADSAFLTAAQDLRALKITGHQKAQVSTSGSYLIYLCTDLPGVVDPRVVASTRVFSGAPAWTIAATLGGVLEDQRFYLVAGSNRVIGDAELVWDANFGTEPAVNNVVPGYLAEQRWHFGGGSVTRVALTGLRDRMPKVQALRLHAGGRFDSLAVNGLVIGEQLVLDEYFGDDVHPYIHVAESGDDVVLSFRGANRNNGTDQAMHIAVTIVDIDYTPAGF